MTEIIDYFKSNSYAMKILMSLVWLVIAVFIINAINRLLFKYMEDKSKYYNIRKTVYYVVSFVYIVIIIMMWGESTQNLTTYIGLLSAGIAIALKEVFSNIAAWVFIVIRKPFDVGQRIMLGEVKGDVIDIRMFQFSLMEIMERGGGEQSTGRIIDVPNHFIFTYPLTNYTKGFQYIWHEISVVITFESDWELAKEKLNEIVIKHTQHLIKEAKEEIREAARKYMIHYNKLTPIVYTNVLDSGVELSLRYMCMPKQKRHTSNIIWEDILKLTKEYDSINLAYPTMRITNE